MKLPSSRYNINHQFQKRRKGNYCWKLRKRKLKTKIFLDLITIRTGRARAERVEEMFPRKLEILLACLDNPYEEVMFESNQIKEQRETMKLQRVEVMLKNT